ncbi:MAG: hypothetical protein ACHBN1_08640 [Heteroscytonema crispum UTEX LB 1556]
MATNYKYYNSYNNYPLPTNHQPQRGDARSSLPRSAEPVAWVGKPYQKRWFTTNNPSGEPVLGGKPKAQYALHHQPTTNHQPPFGFTIPGTRETLPQRWFTNNQQPTSTNELLKGQS